MGFIKELLYRIRGEYTTEKLIKMGLKIGKNFKRLNGVILDPSHCWLIEIGDDVTLAPRVHILCHDASTKIGIDYTRISNVKIGNNVFVGAGTIILPGVTIGDNVVIGAGSVVSKDVPSGVVATGNPVRILQNYDTFINKHQEKLRHKPKYDESYTLRNKSFSYEQKMQMKEEIENSGFGYVE